MLQEFLAENTEEIIRRTRQRLTARMTPAPTQDELKNGVPLFLHEFIAHLALVATGSGDFKTSATQHGGELLAMGFSVSQVVHVYGDICQVITELAGEMEVAITVAEFRILNSCLDHAIAHAVTEYERVRTVSVANEGTERLGILAHELRNKISVSLLALQSLQSGVVAISGSTSALLGRSLRGIRDLVSNSLAGVRIDAGIKEPQQVSVAEIFNEMEVEASLEATAGGFGLVVTPVTEDVFVHGDPQILTAAIVNLLQNAFKFSRKNGTITLRAQHDATKVRIEIEDECGGLPAGKAEELFLPFEQRGSQRSGLGLGLSTSRRGIEAMGGTVTVNDLPGKGCVFIIQMPRLRA